MQLTLRTTAFRILAVFFLAITALSCSQYDYSSPDPGVIDVRLAVKHTRTDLMPFPDSLGIYGSGMVFVMKSLEAVASNDVHLPVLSDLHAIRRNPDGDEFNALSLATRDSMTVLGSTYAPPGMFEGLELVMSPPQGVFISYGFYGSFIPVSPVLPFIGLQRLTADIPIESGRRTIVTVTFDLDGSLLQLTESFLFVPRFYISSVVVQ